MSDPQQVEEDLLMARLSPLLNGGSPTLAELGMTLDRVQELGFSVSEDRVRIPDGIERLDGSRIRDQLSGRALRWLNDLEVFPVVGSTNAHLMRKTAGGSIAGLVAIAELQVKGRGRRGRGWQSPFGSNLALSAGLSFPHKPADLGGFSLCIGLALVDQLLDLGIQGVEVKWPNDVLLHGRKLAGVLIELVSCPDRTDVVVGVGINLQLTPSVRSLIDQPIADLHETGCIVSRNLLAARFLSGIVDYAQGFAQQGFRPMVEAFNSHHRFHRKPVRLIQADGESCGVVQGVTETGELILETVSGTCVYNAGEVSMRDAKA
ncbi:MAG: biotin--[acetyl-CoA-carboxylase] ligase [Pseudomonadales bacterium]|nr:biotin--[acetyl-CoA-carboxylase] ligase [Pseudomonadales bacterium]